MYLRLNKSVIEKFAGFGLLSSQQQAAGKEFI
jgi:hypothetical protein